MALATGVQPILPEAIYPKASAHIYSGVSATREREAKKLGIELKTLDVGRRKFCRGSDLIAFHRGFGRSAKAIRLNPKKLWPRAAKYATRVRRLNT